MDLLLWRHAEAEDGRPDFPDIQRKLTKRGQKQAKRMAAWLKKHAPDDLRIVVSPALRCQETAQALGWPYETDPRLGPDHDVEDLLHVVGWQEGGSVLRTTEKHSAILIVSHQPTLGQTAAFLLSGVKINWQIKKGALCWLTHPTALGIAWMSLKMSVVVPAKS